MKTIAFINRKGGSSKTTTLALLALWWAWKGKIVAIRDLDAQGSALAFTQHIAIEGIKLWKEGIKADYLLADTPGSLKPADLKSVADAADLLILPCFTGPTDLKGTVSTAESIGRPGHARLLWTQINPRTSVWKDQRIEMEKAIGIQPLKSFLCRRTAYSYALTEGLSVLPTAAKTELDKLAKEIR